MQFELISEEILSDDSKRIILKVEPDDLLYLGYILESFEGWCNYTTIKKGEPYLQIDVSPDYVNSIHELLDFLKKWDYGKENFQLH